MSSPLKFGIPKKMVGSNFQGEMERGAAMPQWKKAVVWFLALGYLAATAWQVIARRDDWPLSSFPMYSGLQGRTSSREILVAATDSGEERLRPLAGIGPSRQRHLLAKLAPQKRQKLLDHIRRGLQSKDQAPAGNSLQAIRVYKETWRIQRELKGITQAKRTLTAATYLPPNELLRRLEAEANGSAPTPLPVPAGPSDVVIDLSSQHCEGCSEVTDPYALGGKALRLDCDESSSTASLLFASGFEPGKWWLFARTKTNAPYNAKWSLAVDGRVNRNRVLEVEGLKAKGWVWASHKPGYPAIAINVQPGQPSRIELRCSKHATLVDQLWLARDRKELPVDNAPRVVSPAQPKK